MSMKKGLGRGFESLIPTDLLDDSFDPTAKQDVQLSQLREIPIDQIHPDPDQPRRTFDPEALEELSASITHHGVLQPIIVIQQGDSYQIVAGERRYRAAKMAGVTEMPALVRTFSNQHKLEVSLVENLQRRDLNAIETATAYLKLRNQFNLSLEEIGQRVNKSVSGVSNTLRLLKLPKVVQTAIAEGKLSEGQAKPLVGEDEAFVTEILPRIIAEDWSARKVEQYMVNIKKDRKAPIDAAPETQRYESRISQLKTRLSTDVSIRVNGRGAGRIMIPFKDEQDFERIEKLLEN